MEYDYNFYTDLQLYLTLFGALTIGIGMLLGGKAIGLSKAVRTMFPYIKRDGSNTVMFGFRLEKTYINLLFLFSTFNVASTAAVFFLHIVLDRTSTYNPFDKTYDCFYDNETHDKVEDLSLEMSLDQNVTCFALDLNIGRAVGQATGTLLFSWTVVSVVNWIILNLVHHENCGGKKGCIDNKCHKYCCWAMIAALQIFIFLIPCGLLVVAVLFHEEQKISLLSFYDLIFFCIILFTSSTVFWYWTEREPKTIEEYCSEELDKILELKLKEREDLTKKLYRKAYEKLTGDEKKEAERQAKERAANRLATEEAERPATGATGEAERTATGETERPATGATGETERTATGETERTATGETERTATGATGEAERTATEEAEILQDINNLKNLCSKEETKLETIRKWADLECKRLLIKKSKPYIKEDSMEEIAKKAVQKAMADISIDLAFPPIPELIQNIIATLEPKLKAESNNQDGTGVEEHSTYM